MTPIMESSFKDQVKQTGKVYRITSTLIYGVHFGNISQGGHRGHSKGRGLRVSAAGRPRHAESEHRDPKLQHLQKGQDPRSPPVQKAKRVSRATHEPEQPSRGRRHFRAERLVREPQLLGRPEGERPANSRERVLRVRNRKSGAVARRIYQPDQEIVLRCRKGRESLTLSWSSSPCSSKRKMTAR